MKKCECCDATTNFNLIDFHTINWTAFRNGKGKTKFFCPKHRKECIESMVL